MDEIISKVSESRRTEEDTGAADAGSEEDHVVRLVRGIRRVAGSRASMSDAQISSIVEHLVKQNEERTQRVVHGRTGRLAGVGEFCSAWMSFTAGYLLVGLLGGLLPSILSAAIVGLVGSAAVLPAIRDHTALIAAEWPRASRP